MTPETDSLGKTILLVDSQQGPRETRARRPRLYGITVYTASSIEEARVHFGLNSYHLVLLATREDPEAAISFRREIRQQDPKQRVAFLVGPPRYLSFTFGQNLIPMPSSWRTNSKDIWPAPDSPRFGTVKKMKVTVRASRDALTRRVLKVEKRATLRAEWTSDDNTTGRFFDYVLKKRIKA